MKTFYKINLDNTLSTGSGTVAPNGFTEYTKGSEPQELLDAMFVMSKPSKVSELYTEYSKANQLDIDYMATTFDTAKSTQEIIANNLAIGSVPDGFYFRDINDVDIPMIYAELQSLGEAIQTRGLANFSKLQDLKAQVKLATTQADLDLIVW